MDYKVFYEEIKKLYTRVQHGAISSDEFAYQVGLLLDKADDKQQTAEEK